MAVGHPDHVRAVRRWLAPTLAEQMDFTRLQRVRTTFIPDDLRKRVADLLFRVPFRPAGTELEILVALLIEAQASPDPTMGLRLLRYLVHYWEQEEREWESHKSKGTLRLTPVLASVFYTGEEPWPQLLTLADLMDLPDVWREFVPDPHALLLDVKARPPEDLIARGDPLGWALRVLQREHASLEQLAAVLEEATTELAALADTDEAAWRRLMWYLLLLIYHRRAVAEREPLADIVIGAARRRQREEEIVKMSSTIAGALIREGEIRREARAKRETLLRQLRHKFRVVPIEVDIQIQKLSVADMDRLLEEVLDANSWADLGLDGREE